MIDRHYDVVVLGRSVGALVAAALLARRDFRVLVLGQGARPPSYRFKHHVLRRSAFTMLFASSPTWKRVLAELAQSQTFRRKAFALDPMVAIFLGNHRLELPPDIELFNREIEREFPDVRRVVDDLYAELSRVNAAVDATFERDLVWPPGTFWERRETARAAATLPFARVEHEVDLLADFPASHPYRVLVGTLAHFATNLAAPSGLPAFALARLHGAWTRGLWALARGEDELAEFLLDRIQAHGGTCRLADAVTRIVPRSNGASLFLDGEASPTGASFVVTDGTGESLAELARGEGILKRAERDWPRVSPTHGRFVVSLVLRSDGLPARLTREAFVVPVRTGSRSDERRPVVHLVRLSPSAELDAPAEARDESLLAAEILLPIAGDTGLLTRANAREAVLGTLGSAFPFFDSHLKVVDSPHDGRPCWVYEDGKKHDVERIHLHGASTQAEAMTRQWSLDRPGFLSLAGEPVRGPLPRTFLVGPTVLPALGQEGQLLSAWSASRIITRTDAQKEKMRRAMWSKVEIG